MSGNKGSVAIRFNYNDTSFAFVNVHLSSGHQQTAERLANLRQIYTETFENFSALNTQEKCYHDYKCLFGDTNFRIDLSNKEVRQLVAQKDYAKLHLHDQLLAEKSGNVILNRFSEAPLNFDPTYKYNKNS